MSVWVTIPSARPFDEVAKWAAAWRERGYRIALSRDDGGWTEEWGRVGVEVVLFSHLGFGAYPGYARAVNALIALLMLPMQTHFDAEWFIIAGDDVYPDPNHTADEIAAECQEHFGGSFGVMQPTGDRWGENPNHHRPDMRSAYIDRVAGSAWYGREYCKRVNQGNGPLWPEYQHMFVDEEARAVALKLGVYWERRDLTHHHAHAGRVPHYTVDMIPEHLKKWNTKEHWKEAETIFFRRRKEGFAGSEPL
jgi:hypothetical protein